MKRTKITLYILSLGFILGWWGVAFWPRQEQSLTLLATAEATSTIPHPLTAYLPKLDRKTLHLALSGDLLLMNRLMAEWDVAAEILASRGILVKRQSREEFLRGQILGRELTSRKTTAARCRLLPQTYVAACFLLALADPSEIIAVPAGMRRDSHLYPLSGVPHDLTDYSVEKISLLKPELAFVSDYSHPSALNALQLQKIPLIRLPNPASLEEVLEGLSIVGNKIGRPREAELLKLFTKAALLAIENNLVATHPDLLNHRILYVHSLTHFSLPGNDCLMGELIGRLGINAFLSQRERVPVSIEELIHAKPDCLVISTSTGRRIALPPALTNKVCFVEETVQTCPSQYMVLAYYDLCQALAMKLP